MSKQFLDGIWIVVCDWVDPSTKEGCTLGLDGDPKMFVDPDGGRNANKQYQCGIHHGVLKQEDRPEFKLPEDHKLSEEVLKAGANEISIEEVETDG